MWSRSILVNRFGISRLSWSDHDRTAAQQLVQRLGWPAHVASADAPLQHHAE